MTLPFDLSLRRCQLSAYLAADWVAVSGVNEGDPLATYQDLVLGDCYALRNFVSPQVLNITAGLKNAFRISGARTKPVELLYDATLTFMSDERHMFEALVCVAGPYCTGSTRVYICPLTPNGVADTSYCLIRIQQEDRATALAKAASLSISQNLRSSRGLQHLRKTLKRQI